MNFSRNNLFNSEKGKKRFFCIFGILLITGLIIVSVSKGFWLGRENGENRQNPRKAVEIISQQGKLSEKKTILFVGDIMLDRGVERLMKEKGLDYPFEKISDFFASQDVIIANLEGPIVKEPRNFSDSSMKFAFTQDTARTLSRQGIGIVSLANNHTLDMGNLGLEETREILRRENVGFFGDPLACSKDFLYQKDNVIYLGFNETFPFSCSDQEITATVKDIRNSNTGVFIIVNIHWGDEYQKSSSSFQQNLAHKIIDAGADLIIGHHPHVVQDIGFYKGKLIFYSLGNFIFDQYFSKDTQQGLAVELEFFSDKAIYRLLPIQSHLSQPFLMEEEIKSAFLKDLAQKSSHELKEEIENGKIEIIEIKNSNP